MEDGAPPPAATPGPAGPTASPRPAETRHRPPSLEQILAHKSREVALRRAKRNIRALQEMIRELPPPLDFLAALRDGRKPRLIAEVKKSSPSAGVIRTHFDPIAISRSYERGGAAAISVLTDDRYFGGDLVFLKAIKRAQSLPCLLKDFVIEPYQVYEGRVYGADAILLIVKIVDDAMLRELHNLAASLGMAALVEVHDRAELDRALRLGPRLLGINNRNLKTLETNLGATAELRPLVPPDALVVSESGYKTRAEVDAAREAGLDALLIGETLLRTRDIEGKIHELFAEKTEKPGRTEAGPSAATPLPPNPPPDAPPALPFLPEEEFGPEPQDFDLPPPPSEPLEPPGP